jgi:hypothetical protein
LFGANAAEELAAGEFSKVNLSTKEVMRLNKFFPALVSGYGQTGPAGQPSGVWRF